MEGEGLRTERDRDVRPSLSWSKKKEGGDSKETGDEFLLKKNILTTFSNQSKWVAIDNAQSRKAKERK